MALAQTALAEGLLKAARPGIETETVIIRTSGDRDRRPFAEIGGKGLFTTEVEGAVVRGDADIGVHSAKDLTAEIAPGCSIHIVDRGPVHDVVVGGAGGTGEERLAGLVAGTTVGTSSMRRRSQLAAVRPDIVAVELRGNVETRVARVDSGEIGAAILAAAGLARAGLLPDGGELDPWTWVPAPAQGAIAIEAAMVSDELGALLDEVTDAPASAEVACERAFSARLEGGCSIPLGCLAALTENTIAAAGFLGDQSGAGISERLTGSAEDPEGLGVALAESVLKLGGEAMLAAIRPEP